MRRRFFVDQFDGDRAILRGETAEHLGRVLRAEPGQLYELSDGKEVWLGRIEEVRRDAIRFALVEPIAATEQALRIRLLLSIIKFDHFEWCIEKAAELGVSEIVPLAAARSEKTLVAAAEKRSRRWKKILAESAQQSRRLRAPALAAVSKPDAAFAGVSQTFQQIVLSEKPEAPAIRSVLRQKPVAALRISGQASSAPASVGAPLEVALAVGPEGGWTEEEVNASRDAGFEEVSLGKNILRTETAVIAALAVINYALGE